MKKYVIIGGGVAAVGCIEGIRERDRETKIVLITDENRPVYCRPLISYYLQGRTDFEKMKYRSDSFYEEMNCDLIYGKAVRIDPQKSEVVLESGDAVEYEKLCVATGSSPFVPPFKGLDTVKEKFSFMTEEDALSINNAISENSRVLIVGAGLIGLKCAEGICERVKSVTVCDLAERVLSSILDDTCAMFMQRALEEHGVSFLLGDSADRFDGRKAFMKSGKEIEFDILILAVGVRPNTSLISDIAGEVQRGIIVDEKMQTTLTGIYSAGDCTQGYDASIGEKRILAILPNAYMQGHCAGVNMAGGDCEFSNAIPMNAIGFFGTHALTAGSYDGEMFEKKTENGIKRLFINDGLLKGFMLIGDIDRAGIYTSLIRERTPLSDVDFEVLKNSPALIAFSSQWRRKKLGGVL